MWMKNVALQENDVGKRTSRQRLGVAPQAERGIQWVAQRRGGISSQVGACEQVWPTAAESIGVQGAGARSGPVALQSSNAG